MALYPALSGTDALVRIYNNDGSEAGACGNGMRCVASRGSAETGKARSISTRSAGASPAGAPPTACSRWIWACLVSLGRDLARRGDARHARDRLQFGPLDPPLLRSPSAVSMGNPHAIFWVDDLDAYDLPGSGPSSKMSSSFPSAPTSRSPHSRRASVSSSAPGSAVLD